MKFLVDKTKQVLCEMMQTPMNQHLLTAIFGERSTTVTSTVLLFLADYIYSNNRCQQCLHFFSIFLDSPITWPKLMIATMIKTLCAHLLRKNTSFNNATSRAIVLTALRHSPKSRSGYESETAEIQDSLRQFSLSENYAFKDDEEDKPQAKLSNSMPLRSKKDKSEHVRFSEFVDYRRVKVKGGSGGDGKICFLSLMSNPMAGPSGGDGGNGGHIIFEACKDVKSLNNVKSHYTGLLGERGEHKDMNGANAEHLFVKVPVGTLVKDAFSGRLVADMNDHGVKYLAARGGAGGKGNHYFLSNQNRHPRVAEMGAKGEEKELILELKMIAHAGLVGFPNAGKSTLLSAVSRAKPKVASYPFTTLKPSVGIIHYDDGEQLAIADMPGLIEEAHLNRGLGIGFLRHIERCVCLFYVVDISASEPYQQFKVLVNELTQYKDNLATRPTAVIVNKMDVEGAEEKLADFTRQLQQDSLSHLRVIAISAKYGQNLSELLIHFRELYDIYRFEKFHKDL